MNIQAILVEGVVIKKMTKNFKIHTSRTWRQPIIALEILRNTPTLDPLAVLFNSKVLFIKKGDKIVSFVAVKKYFKTYEIGTVYTNPESRGKGYASFLINHILKKQNQVFLLCKKQMIPFYEKLGFYECLKSDTIINIRRMLFNYFIAPLRGHTIVSMKYNKGRD